MIMWWNTLNLPSFEKVEQAHLPVMLTFSFVYRKMKATIPVLKFYLVIWILG